MKGISYQDIILYVEQNISTFHSTRLKRLRELNLSKILKRKNPYLFKVKNILTAQELIMQILNAYLSSQEETIFGGFLEGLAIYINEKVYGGWKSSAKGIDLEFNQDDIRYIVSIKSGPNWGNSSQIAKLKSDFNTTKKIIRTNNKKKNIIAVNGCCYGRNLRQDKGEYFKYCGQVFWEFISGDENLYTAIIEPLGHQAKKRNEEFQKKYAQIVNNFTLLFINNFCDNGEIIWEDLVRYNSSQNTVENKLT